MRLLLGTSLAVAVASLFLAGAACDPTAHYSIDAGGVAAPDGGASEAGAPDVLSACATAGASCNSITGPFCCAPGMCVSGFCTASCASIGATCSASGPSCCAGLTCDPFSGTCLPAPPDAGPACCFGLCCLTSADCCSTAPMCVGGICE